MTAPRSAPDATIYRLSMYHCYLGELLRAQPDATVTSRALAEELGLKEESVRRDISFIGSVGRPGAGYGAAKLHEAIQAFLGLEDLYPVVRIGSAAMLAALEVLFPSEAWGISVAGYFTENAAEAGATAGGIEIHDMARLPGPRPRARRRGRTRRLLTRFGPEGDRSVRRGGYAWRLARDAEYAGRHTCRHERQSGTYALRHQVTCLPVWPTAEHAQ